MGNCSFGFQSSYCIGARLSGEKKKPYLTRKDVPRAASTSDSSSVVIKKYRFLSTIKKFSKRYVVETGTHCEVRSYYTAMKRWATLFFFLKNADVAEGFLKRFCQRLCTVVLPT